MANKPISKLLINKERFIDYIHSKGVSIRKLGQEIDRTEKTLRRNLNNGEMPPGTLYMIAKYLDADVVELYSCVKDLRR